MKLRMTRRSLLGGLLAAGCLPASVYAYMRREAEAVEISRRQIPIRGITGPIKVVQISDTHMSPAVSIDYLQRCSRLAVAENPDLIFLTGDYTTQGAPDTDAAQSIFTPLANAAPTYAVIGNHDFIPLPDNRVGFAPMLALLTSCGVRTLFNEATVVSVRNSLLNLVGLGDIWSGTCQPQDCLISRNTPAADIPTVLLSHNPDSKTSVAEFQWDLMLSGHTHGGQIRVPFTEIRPVLPLADRSLAEGIYTWNERLIYINRGVGNLHGLRFNCPPEISVIELIPHTAHAS